MSRDETQQKIQDELEIRNLIAALAHLADDGDLEDYIALFAEDARWGGGGQPVRTGHAALLEGAQARRDSGVVGPGTGARHVVTTTWLEIDGERATGRSVFHFYTAIDTATPTLSVMGTYADVFVRTSAGWKLAERMLQGDARDLGSR